MTREEWLVARSRSLGSSDAPKCVRNPLRVYLDKIGALPPCDNASMRAGRMLEDYVAARYEERTGAVLALAPQLIYHPAYAWMHASIDRLDHEGHAVELKTARSDYGWGEEGSDEIPEDYLLQVHHQMCVLGSETATLCVVFRDSLDCRVYPIRRSVALTERLVEIESALWRRVERRDPPAPDWTDPAVPDLLELLHKPTKGVRVELSATNLVDDYQRLGKAISMAEGERALVRAMITMQMGDANEGILPDGRIVRREERVRNNRARDASQTTYLAFDILKAKGKRNGTRETV